MLLMFPKQTRANKEANDRPDQDPVTEATTFNIRKVFLKHRVSNTSLYSSIKINNFKSYSLLHLTEHVFKFYKNQSNRITGQ